MSFTSWVDDRIRTGVAAVLTEDNVDKIAAAVAGAVGDTIAVNADRVITTLGKTVTDTAAGIVAGVGTTVVADTDAIAAAVVAAIKSLLPFGEHRKP